MATLIIQTLLLIAIAFILGAVVGSVLRGIFHNDKPDTTTEPAKAEKTKGNVQTAKAHKLTATIDPKIPQPPIPSAATETPDKTSTKASTNKPKKPIKRPADTASATPDNLKLIRGIGPQNEGWLNELGINTFRQIAGWSSKDEVYFGDVLAFPGRIEREEWVKQAKVLAKGGSTEFAKRVQSGKVSGGQDGAVTPDLGRKPKGLLKAPREKKADKLTLIDGVGNAIEKKMTKLGVFHFDQISQMSASELTWLGNAVGFPGRPERENWAGEAKALSKDEKPANSEKTPKRGVIKSS